MNAPVILASASPRRRRILARFGVPFQVRIPRVEEVHWTDRPADCVRENAARKHAWCREREPDAAILAADTLVLFEGQLIGKPADHAAARRWLTAFSGRRQTVLTACAVSWPDGSVELSLDAATVTFRTLSDDAIDVYLTLVNPLDKAGGYDVDQHGDRVVAGYAGEWTTVMGLSESRVRRWLAAWSAVDG